METLATQRISHCYQWGKRDQRNGCAFSVPVFLRDETERNAYTAGYCIAEAQASRRARLNATGEAI